MGKVGGDSLVVNINGKEFINGDIFNLKKLWLGALEAYVR